MVLQKKARKGEMNFEQRVEIGTGVLKKVMVMVMALVDLLVVCPGTMVFVGEKRARREWPLLQGYFVGVRWRRQGQRLEGRVLYRGGMRDGGVEYHAWGISKRYPERGYLRHCPNRERR